MVHYLDTHIHDSHILILLIFFLFSREKAAEEPHGAGPRDRTRACQRELERV